jgi:hypothetical protein
MVIKDTCFTLIDMIICYYLIRNWFAKFIMRSGDKYDKYDKYDKCV